MARPIKFRADTSGLDAAAKKRSADYDAGATAGRAKVTDPTPAPTKVKSSGQSFRDAFKEARANGDKTFRWGSKSYTTDMASAKPKPKPKAASTPAPAAKPSTPAPSNAGKINTGPARPLADVDVASALRRTLGRGPVGAPPADNAGAAARAADMNAISAKMRGPKSSASAAPLTPRQRATQYTDPSRMADTNKYLDDIGMKKGGKVRKFAKGGATYPLRIDISKKAAPAKPDNRPAPPVTQKALDGYARTSATEEAGDSKVMKTKKFAKGGATGFGPHTEKSTPSKMPTPFKMGKAPSKGKASSDGKAPVFGKGKPSTKGKSAPPPFVKGTTPSFAKGGSVDGIAVRGKTRAMKRGGKC